MRSRPELLAAALLCLWVTGAPRVTQAADAAGTVTQAEVERAVKKVQADPALASERTVKSLGWKDDGEPDEPRKRTRWPSWLSWIGDLFTWIGQASQALVYLVLIALVALLIVFIVRLVRSSSLDVGGKKFVAPTHVQDLDIRPESLPPDVGAAARALWDRGEHRAALALLYRGLLSRLAHVHEVPIRDSSTEGDCLALAAGHLDAARLEYATSLVRTWQRFTYGGLTIDDATVHELCAGFAANLDAPAAAQNAGEGLAGSAA